MDKQIVILSGRPNEKEWQSIKSMVEKGYVYANSLPPGISWEAVKKEDVNK